ncbi:hypothetical protein TNCV_3152981 [Trichonephila clavipes]|nr:hypothetical protein TNCV_3152981 [Trichonephila clavipes]
MKKNYELAAPIKSFKQDFKPHPYTSKCQNAYLFSFSRLSRFYHHLHDVGGIVKRLPIIFIWERIENKGSEKILTHNGACTMTGSPITWIDRDADHIGLLA